MLNLPQTITELGLAYRHYGDLRFGMRQPDLLMHMYVVGQTGTGKSTLLHTMSRQDDRASRGFCLIDPHGDLAEALHRDYPEALYWNVADPDSPYGYNPLTKTSASLRPLVTSGLIDALKKQWSDAWGVRMEHLLRHAVLALLDTANPDLRDIPRVFWTEPFGSKFSRMSQIPKS